MTQNEKLKVLEIGVSEYGDGSLKAYAQSDMVECVVGVDVKEYTGQLLDNMRFYALDAYTKEAIREIEKKEGTFDIIIDDGSHLYEHQTFFLDNYVELLDDGGLLICEDVSLLRVINEQCAREDVFYFDGWGNLELNVSGFNDPKTYQHNERIIVKAKSEKLTDYVVHDNKPHIPRLPVTPFRDYKRDSTELAISVPLYHPDYPEGCDKYSADNFRDVHCKGAIWAAMSFIHNTDLGDRGTPLFFHIEDKVWNDAMPVFKEFGVPQEWCRKMSLPEPSKTLTAIKPQYGKSLMGLIDNDIDADVTLILDSDFFTCVTGGKLRLYDKLTMPILKRQPSMTYFHRKDLPYGWWVSVVMGSAALSLDLLKTEPLNVIEQMGYEELGFEKELENAKHSDKVNRYFVDEYLKTFPRQHPARDFAVEILPQCYTPCYAFLDVGGIQSPANRVGRLVRCPSL